MAVRILIAAMVFFTVVTIYLVRLQFSMLIVAMIKYEGNLKPPACNLEKNMSYYTEYPGPKYNWNNEIEQLLIVAYTYGYIFTGILGGMLSERYSCRQVIFWGSLSSGVLTIVTGYSANVHYYLVFVCRFLCGLAGGLLYPATHTLIANWAPIEERGRFASLLLGCELGSAIAYVGTGSIADYWNFNAAFVATGTFLLLFAVVFFLLVSDRPQNHPFISREERRFIIISQRGLVSSKKRIAPYRKILRCCPFIVMCFGHFGTMWGIYFQITMLPKFMAEVLDFHISEAGGISTMPFLTRLISGIIYGYLGDLIRKRQWLTMTNRLKLAIVCSHIIPGLVLGCIVLAGCRYYYVIGLMTFCMVFNAATVITTLQAPLEIAPNFAGSLYGIMQTFSAPSGFIIPVFTAHVSKKRNGVKEWGWNFLIGSTVNLLCGYIYIIFCSPDIQPFNEVELTDQDQIEVEPVEVPFIEEEMTQTEEESLGEEQTEQV